ncbi:MAG: ABC-2 family transporter protein [Anaerolineae bacterium]|nr:ABC-2 family transporter protein [Anaerolineae bacterium]
MPALARYTFVARTAARQQWVYRGELWMRLLSMVLYMGIFVALWSTVFAARNGLPLSGYGLAEMAWYLAITETITLSSSRAFVTIAESVKSGDLVYTLTRPINYPLFQVAQSLGDSVPRLVLNFLTAALVVCIGTGQWAGSGAGFLAFLGTALLALILDALVAVLIGLAAFWLEEVTPIFWIYQKLLFTVGGLFLPLEFFPNWLRGIAEWLPFRFIASAPARAFVAFDPAEVASAVLGQLGYIAATTVLVSLIWRSARRRMVLHGG